MTMMTETLVSGTTPVSDNVNLKQHLNTPSEEGQTLRGSVEKALHNYFAHLEGASVTDVYNLVLSEVEAPLLESMWAGISQPCRAPRSFAPTSIVWKIRKHNAPTFRRFSPNDTRAW